MPNRNALSIAKVIAFCLVLPSLDFFSFAGAACAQNTAVNYTLLVASGFICDPTGSGTCPAVAKSVNGDSYEISGAGTFDPRNKSVKSTGTFNHRAPDDTILDTGVWLATDLISFDSYGIAPTALLQRGPAFVRLQLGPKLSVFHSRSVPAGGLATFRIVLMPVSGATKTALLQINCALGDVPRERSVDGIRITLERNNLEYSEESSGRVMFLVPAI